jgi:hypothetical protein
LKFQISKGKREGNGVGDSRFLPLVGMTSRGGTRGARLKREISNCTCQISKRRKAEGECKEKEQERFFSALRMTI